MVGRRLLKIYNGILLGVSELLMLSSSAVVFSNFKVSMAQETVEGGDRILGGRDGFLRCIVIKAS